MAACKSRHTVQRMEPDIHTSDPAALQLFYTVRSCRWGQVLVAGDAQGLAFVLLGDDKASLVQDVMQRLPQAQWATGNVQLHGWSDAVLRHLDRPQAPAQVPLRWRTGTAFQQQVWQALLQIPLGQTRTYAQLAQAMGQQQAVRAVANACAANPLAVLVPCHRVLRSDGGWGGYRWGLTRKQGLLALEQAAVPSDAAATLI